MGRHRQPRELAELKGATKKNPQRYRNEVPESKLPLGDPPKHMTKEAIACWREIEFYSLRGVLKGSDRLKLEIISNELSAYRRAPQEFKTARLNTLNSMLSEYGFSPSARGKLGVEPRPLEGDFSEFAAPKRAN